MKKLFAVVLFFAGLLVLSSGADASNCVVRNRVVVQHQAVVVATPVVAVTPVVAAVYQPIAVPAYSVGYASQNLHEENERLKLEIKLQRLEIQLQSLQQNQQVPQQLPLKKEVQQQPEQHPAIAIINKSCLQCHSPATKAKGGQLDLTGPLTDRQLLAVSKEVYSGRMPKNGKLTDEEVGQIMSWLDTIK